MARGGCSRVIRGPLTLAALAITALLLWWLFEPPAAQARSVQAISSNARPRVASACPAIFDAFNNGSFSRKGEWASAPVFAALHSSVLATNSEKVAILSIGDSVDRFLLAGLCSNSTHRTWGDDILKYVWPMQDYNESNIRRRLGTSLCNRTWGTWAFAHHFGAHSHGMYFMKHSNHPLNPNVDTSLRIPDIIKLYRERIGLPTLVLYQSNLWDSGQIDAWSEPPDPSWLRLYAANISRNVALIRSLLPPGTAMALRTNPIAGKEKKNVAEEVMNAVLMRIAAASDPFVGAVDVAGMLAPYAESDRKVYLLDEIHPNDKFAAGISHSVIQLAQVLRAAGC